MKRVALIALFAILACTTSQQPAATSQFKNLQVLPKDIPREQLLATMRGFTRGLGVRCNHCHVVAATEPKEELDFPSDAKEEKRAARTMLRMTQELNRTWIPRVDAAAAGQMRVSCWTCHRGKPEPEAPPPPEPRPQ
ncbi:MAG TPA: c-type cytochrome [Thermoanaerobaculia bacterium]|nr:c-type cytochrome [Thermoanaerobaculia bacterium]